MIPLLLRDDRKAAWENTGVEERAKGRREEGDEGMLVLRRCTCWRRRRGQMGGQNTVGGRGKWGVRL